MDMLEVIYARRSVRAYAQTPVDRSLIEELLACAVQAPTGMNTQPWAFGVVQGSETLRAYADRAKKMLLEMFGEADWFARYKQRVEQPDYSVFHNAPALVAIYAKSAASGAKTDCCLAAENLMLSACAKGLGTCWIGFSTAFFQASETKKELGVPEDCEIVAPIVLGYAAGPAPAVEKGPPEVLFWK
jgi:nitroreductase